MKESILNGQVELTKLNNRRTWRVALGVFLAFVGAYSSTRQHDSRDMLRDITGLVTLLVMSLWLIFAGVRGEIRSPRHQARRRIWYRLVGDGFAAMIAVVLLLIFMVGPPGHMSEVYDTLALTVPVWWVYWFVWTSLSWIIAGKRAARMPASGASRATWKWIVVAKYTLGILISAVLLIIAIVSWWGWREHLQKSLMVAAQHDDAARVRQLLAVGVDPNWRGGGRCYDCEDTSSPAICSAKKPEILKLLIEHGGNVNAQCGDGYTRLLEFVYYEDPLRSVEAVRLLLEHGADGEAKSREGESAISVASEMAKHDNRWQMIIKLLNDTKYRRRGRWRP